MTVVQDGQNTDDKTDIEIAQDSAADQVGYMADGNSYIYKALGLEYDEEQKAWMWKENQFMQSGLEMRE